MGTPLQRKPTQTVSKRPRRTGGADPVEVAFVAWSSVGGRSQEIAAALSGDSRCYFDFNIVAKPLVPLRYAASAARTVAYLAARRPSALIVSLPPALLGLLALAYGRLTGARVVLDSHPTAFSAKRRLSGPLHRWLTPRVAGTMVTGAPLDGQVAAWGGTPIEVHEAPPGWEVAPARELGATPTLLFVCRLAPDEPVEEAVEAARMVPEARFRITGDIRKVSPALRAGAPPNVEFTDFLTREHYVRAVEEADVVMTLTRVRESVPRAAYEAVYARRPLIIASEIDCGPELFPSAIAVANTPESISAGVRAAIADHATLVRAADEAHATQMRRWEDQLAALEDLLRPDRSSAPTSRAG